MHKLLPSIEIWMFRKAKEVSEMSQVYLRAGWNELTTVINWVSSSVVEEVAPMQSSMNRTKSLGFGPWYWLKKLMFNKTYEKIGVAGSHFSTHGHAISLFAEWKAIECEY